MSPTESQDRPRRLWLFNLDAEDELAGSKRYLPTRAARARVERESCVLARALARPGDYVLAEDASGEPGRLSARVLGPEGLLVGPPLSATDLAERARGSRRAVALEACAWSPTPRAARLLASVGAPLAPAPGIDVLRRVNERPFAACVRAPLAGASFVKDVATSLEQLLELVARPAPDGWLVRRAFGVAGRGRRRLWAGRPDSAELAWLVAGLRLGPLVVEPFVRITREYTRSGEVRGDGTIAIFGPCAQRTTSAGAWTDSTALAAGEVGREDDAALAQAFEVAGRALHGAGYAGPFGVDGFRHRDPWDPGREVLNALSEINARYTMDWSAATTTPPLPDQL